MRPNPVSPWFRFDWQYVLSAGRLPAFKPVAFVLALMPILKDLPAVIPKEVATFVPINVTTFWLLWGASVSSLIAFGITRVRCPSFVRDYEKFDDYEKVGHSHRWIGWQLYLNRKDYSKFDRIVQELIDKNIILPAGDAVDPAEFAVCPLMPAASRSSPSLDALEPVNANRDLYIGFWIYGDRYVLPLQESDPHLQSKIKELFWVMFTNLVSSRKKARITVWFFYTVTLILTGSVLIMKLVEPLKTLLHYMSEIIQGMRIS